MELKLQNNILFIFNLESSILEEFKVEYLNNV